MASKEIMVHLEENRGNAERIFSLGQGGDAASEAIERMEFTVEGTERGPPPTYDEAMNPASAPPPTYESVIGRVREVHKESSGTVDFMKKVLILLIGTIGCTIAVSVTIVIPFAMFIIGSNYFYECPVNSHIPLYLLVEGLIGVFKLLLQLFHRVKQGHNRIENEEHEEKHSSLQSLLTCFLLTWFILGSYWVYKEYQPNYDPSLGLYCNKTVYLFAFWQITFVYLMFGLITMCFCSVSLCVIFFARRRHIREADADPDRELQSIHD